MKKLFILVLSLFMVFPLLSETYEVISIEGKVFYGASQKELQINDTLREDDVLNVRPQTRVILQAVSSNEKRTFKKPGRITIKDAWDNFATGKGLKKQVVVKPTTIAPSNKGTNKSVVTAASRASDAKEDLDWAE